MEILLESRNLSNQDNHEMKMNDNRPTQRNKQANPNDLNAAYRIRGSPARLTMRASEKYWLLAYYLFK